MRTGARGGRRVGDGRVWAVLWSYTDRTRLTPLATLIAVHAAIPVLISADGRTAVQINPDNALTLWDLQPVNGVVDNPTARACQLANLGYQRWREIEPNPAFDTPCLPPPLPQLDNPTPSDMCTMRRWGRATTNEIYVKCRLAHESLHADRQTLMRLA